MTTIHRTLAEQEVTARYDQDERVLWLGTSTPWVARRWQRARYAVRVVGTVGGAPASWEVKLPWAGRKTLWVRAFSASLPRATKQAADTTGNGRSRAQSAPAGALSPSTEQGARGRVGLWSSGNAPAALPAGTGERD